MTDKPPTYDNPNQTGYDYGNPPADSGPWTSTGPPPPQNQQPQFQQPQFQQPQYDGGNVRKSLKSYLSWPSQCIVSNIWTSDFVQPINAQWFY